ncbi:MAG: ATP-binding protein [Evtepia gabavorous]
MVGRPDRARACWPGACPPFCPALTQREALEATQIHSVMGLTTKEHPLLTQRPFRAPHHTISAGGMAGGGDS